MERRLDKMRLCALLIDATPFARAADGGCVGHQSGRAENDLGHPARSHRERDGGGRVAGRPDEARAGFQPSRGCTFWMAARRCSAAVKKHAGESAPIQRCQVHKRRNVLDHLTDEQKPSVAKKLNAAYALEDYAAAKQALNTAASRTDGSESERGAEFGRRNGGNADRASASRCRCNCARPWPAPT